MSGALAERVFAAKLDRVGFVDLQVVDRRPFGIADIADIPLFTPDVLELMHELLPREQQDRVATSVVVLARKPAG